MSNLNVVNYNVGYEDTATGGANYLSIKSHIWTRPPHSLLAGYIITSNANVLESPYADTPVVRDTVDPNLLGAAASTAYGYYITGTSNKLTNANVYVNPSNDGVGRPYGQDIQVNGIQDNGGSNFFESPTFNGGSVTKRLAQGIAGTAIGTSRIWPSPGYNNVAAGTRIAAVADGMGIRKGGVSQSCLITNFDDGTGFGAVATDYSAYPNPNGTTGTRQSFQDFQKTAGTTGLSAIRIFNATGDGGVIPSDQVNHQFSARGQISYIAHSKTTEFPTIVVGAQDSLSLINTISTRASTTQAVFDIRRPVVFGSSLLLPTHTTASRLPVGLASLAYNTTNGALEVSDAGAWAPLVANIVDGDKGDITVSGAGSVWTVDNNTISNAKLDDVPSSSIKGRLAAGLGDPQDLTPSEVRTIINVANGATANSPDATLVDRANHTGTQLAATISDFNTVAEARADIRIAASSVDALSDVAITAPIAGQVIKWNGTQWVNGADATGSATYLDISWTAHGRSVGDVIRVNGSTFSLANNTTVTDSSGIIGVVATVIDANTLAIATIGSRITGSSFTPGVKYLNNTGNLTSTAPTSGQISVPICVDTDTVRLVGQFVGFQIP
jgi:hypothetical protein